MKTPNDPRVAVRRFDPSEWTLYRDLRLGALAEAPDAFGSEYRREAMGTDEDWQIRLQNGARSDHQLPLLACVADAPAGLCWSALSTEKDDTVHLYQMWVAPPYRGLGVARVLLDVVIDWARRRGADELRLAVTLTSLLRHVCIAGQGSRRSVASSACARRARYLARQCA